MASHTALSLILKHMEEMHGPTVLPTLVSELECCRLARSVDAKRLEADVTKLKAQLSQFDECATAAPVRRSLPAPDSPTVSTEPSWLQPKHLGKFLEDAMLQMETLQALVEELETAIIKMRKYVAEPPTQALKHMLASLTSFLNQRRSLIVVPTLALMAAQGPQQTCQDSNSTRPTSASTDEAKALPFSCHGQIWRSHGDSDEGSASTSSPWSDSSDTLQHSESVLTEFVSSRLPTDRDVDQSAATNEKSSPSSSPPALKLNKMSLRMKHISTAELSHELLPEACTTGLLEPYCEEPCEVWTARGDPVAAGIPSSRFESSGFQSVA